MAEASTFEVIERKITKVWVIKYEGIISDNYESK